MSRFLAIFFLIAQFQNKYACIEKQKWRHTHHTNKARPRNLLFFINLRQGREIDHQGVTVRHAQMLLKAIVFSKTTRHFHAAMHDMYAKAFKAFDATTPGLLGNCITVISMTTRHFHAAMHDMYAKAFKAFDATTPGLLGNYRKFPIKSAFPIRAHPLFSDSRS